MVGLISTADDIYALLLKPQWHPAIPHFKTLCMVGLFYPIAAVSYNILKVRSNGSIILRLEVLKKVVMTIILIVTIPLSVMAIAWGLVAAAAFEMVVNFIATRRYTALTAWSYIRTLLPVAAVTAIMYGAIMAEANLIAEWSVGLRLAVKIVTGVVVYIAASAALRMEALSETITIAKQFLSRKK
jgi:O-antigen/teichoic acid export membrane protein